MGCGASRVSCPRCGAFSTSNGQLFIDHLNAEHSLKCPKCGQSGMLSSEELIRHLETHHQSQEENNNDTAVALKCPKCLKGQFFSADDLADHVTKMHVDCPPSLSLQKMDCPNCGEEHTLETLADHLQRVHIEEQITESESEPLLATQNITITCPKCSKSGFESGDAFVVHLENVHMFSSRSPADDSQMEMHDNEWRNMPKIGDKVVAMWSRAMWQYFHATIVQFSPDTMKYEINWDDGDTTGRIVDYYNLALDRVPKKDEIGIGSIILFPQGSYSAGATQLTGGLRWHQGKITNITSCPDGSKRYSGCHTKGIEDGKSVKYGGYSYEFTEMPLSDLRIGPNVFDILEGEMTQTVGMEDIDIFFSYTKADSPLAIRNNEVQSVPDSYVSRINDICDPVDIAKQLKDRGLKVVDQDKLATTDLKKTAGLLKKARVFVACISDQYVKDERCRMEFQYAKTTLKKPVVPLVVGDSSFEWTFSVVGLLLAGELYIHFKDKSVEEAKNAELLKTLNNYLNAAAVNDSSPTEVKGKADVFISYSWSNSMLAHEAHQVEKLIGDGRSDPRQVKNYLGDNGFNTWLDIERLQSANADSGLFEQLTKGIIEAKAVVAFISDEYASSPNCRMEFQFALKSLSKPVIPVVVGTGKAWQESVVGALLSAHQQQPISLQTLSSSDEYQEKLKLITTRLSEIVNATTQKKTASRKSRAPQVGDHVVCHHFDWTYYMATVVSYDQQEMLYTVNWDDGDPSGRVQPFNQVALDSQPDADDIGVDSIVFFPQGKYVGTEGNNSGGVRYHEGIVTRVDRRANGEVFLDGHHNKGKEDGKMMFKAYEYEFKNMPLSSVRMAPTALDAIMA